MGEIASAMLNGQLCCECGVALQEDCDYFEVPVRCNDCHSKYRVGRTQSFHGTFSETGIKSIIKSKDIIRYLQPMIEYNIEVELANTPKFFHNRTKLVEFIAHLLDAYSSEDEE